MVIAIISIIISIISIIVSITHVNLIRRNSIIAHKILLDNGKLMITKDGEKLIFSNLKKSLNID